MFILPPAAWLTIDPSDEFGDVIAVGGDGGAEVELVGDEAAERMALCGPILFRGGGREENIKKIH